MKKMILVLSIIIFCATYFYGDVIPPDSHYVTRSVTISGLSAYSDLQLIGYITGPMIQGYEITAIKENVSLNKGYKFNTFKVYAIKTSLVEAKGGLDAIDFSQVVAVLAPVAILDPGSYYVANSNPLSAETVVYKVAGYKDNTLVLYIAERKLEYNNGASPKMETYSYNP